MNSTKIMVRLSEVALHIMGGQYSLHINYPAALRPSSILPHLPLKATVLAWMRTFYQLYLCTHVHDTQQREQQRCLCVPGGSNASTPHMPVFLQGNETAHVLASLGWGGGGHQEELA